MGTPTQFYKQQFEVSNRKLREVQDIVELQCKMQVFEKALKDGCENFQVCRSYWVDTTSELAEELINSDPSYTKQYFELLRNRTSRFTFVLAAY